MFHLTRSFVLKSAKKRQPFRALFLVLSLLFALLEGSSACPTHSFELC